MSRLNKYRNMWIFVLFDLPVVDEEYRKAYTKLRKSLLKDGFSMMQYSVYARHCASRENADAHTQRVKAVLPDEGMVSILTITDKQFGDIKNFWGKKRKESPPQAKQLEMF